MTQHVRDEHVFRVGVALGEHKSWWRDIEQPHPLHVTLAGQDHGAAPRVQRLGRLVEVVTERLVAELALPAAPARAGGLA